MKIVNPNGEVDGDSSPHMIVRPAICLAASSLTDFSYHSAQKSIMTNYDYTQYDAVAARLRAKAARDAAKLEEYGSVLDDGGFGIHKCRPVADDEFSVTDPPGGQVEECESVNSKYSSASSVKRWRSLDIHSLTKCSSDVSVKSNRSWDGRKMIDDNQQTYLTTPETDAFSRQLKPFSNETETPLVTNSSLDRRTNPIITRHFAPEKGMSKQLLDKFVAMKSDERSASTALTSRLTDDDTTIDGVVSNSTNASRETKEEIEVECFDSFCADDDAAEDIFRENVISYNSLFSSQGGSEDALLYEVVSVSRSFSTLHEPESKTEIASPPSVTEQSKEDKEPSVTGLACIQKLDTRKLSYDFYQGSLNDDDESLSESSFDSIDSLIRKQPFPCDPCGIGGIMDDISDAIHDIANVFNIISPKRQADVSERKGNSTDSQDDESKTRRNAKFLRHQERELSRRMLV